LLSGRAGPRLLLAAGAARPTRPIRIRRRAAQPAPPALVGTAAPPPRNLVRSRPYCFRPVVEGRQFRLLFAPVASTVSDVSEPRRNSMTRSLAILVLLCLFAGLAFADSPQTGTIDGVVIDASGSPLPGVSVTLVTDRGDKNAVTDEAGKFLFGLLPPGQY